MNEMRSSRKSKKSNPHLRQTVLRICIIPSVLSSHSPPLPLTIPPPRPAAIPPPKPPVAPSWPSSMRSALVQTTMIGTPAALCVSVPGPSGNTVLEDRDEDGAMGSDEGSV